MNFSRVGGAGTMSSEKLRLIAISRQTLSIISLLCRSVKTRAVNMESQSQRGNPGSIIQWYALGKNVKTVMERRNLAYSWSQNTHLEDALLWFCFTLSTIDHYSGLSAYDSEGLWTSGLERKEGNARFHICRGKSKNLTLLPCRWRARRAAWRLPGLSAPRWVNISGFDIFGWKWLWHQPYM